MNAEQFMAQYTSEYIGRLAYSLAQFWTADEELPTPEAREDEIFYKVSIRRLSAEERLSLVASMRAKADVAAGFFDKEFCESRGAIQRILGIIARFPELKTAHVTEKLLFLRRHNFVV
jgi:hypothetical protein